MANYANNVLYALYRDVVEENQRLKAENARRECGCCYCKQGAEWGICGADGVSNEPHVIYFCPMCGKKIQP